MRIFQGIVTGLSGGRQPVLLSLLWAALSYSSSTLAYIGPGLGAGTIGVVIGVIGSIFLALFAVLYYPIKRALKKRKAGASGDAIESQSAEAPEQSDERLETESGGVEERQAE